MDKFYAIEATENRLAIKAWLACLRFLSQGLDRFMAMGGEFVIDRESHEKIDQAPDLVATNLFFDDLMRKVATKRHEQVFEPLISHSR